MNTRSSKLALSTLVVLAPVLALTGYLVTSGETPDPMPSHWDLHGHVNGSTDPTALVAGFVGAASLVALGEILLLWRVKHSTQALPSVLSYVGWLLGLTYLQIALLARGAHDASSVLLPWYCVVLLVVAPVVPALLTWWLCPRAPVPSVRLGATTLTLGSQERVVWIGHAQSRPLAGLGLLALAAAAALGLVAPVVALVVGVVGLAVVGVSSISVRADGEGLHTLWGPVGWPRALVPLDDVASAQAQEIQPLAWGGWGYRVGRHGVAAVVRRGPGLVVERREHPTYAVTVDGAEQGADVLNALLARHTADDADVRERGTS